MKWQKPRIAKQREANKMTQAALAAKINAAQQTIAGYEGETAEPSLAVFRRLAEALGCAPEWLAFGVNPNKDQGQIDNMRE